MAMQMEQQGVAPQQQMMTNTSATDDLGARLSSVDRVHVEQSWYIGDCCNILNHYNLYANDRKGDHLAIVREEASCCEKACCAPNHSFLLKLSYPENPDDVKYTFERRGIFAGKPCLCCCAFGDSCQDELTLHEGNMEGEAGSLSAPNPLYTARQAPASESMFAPMIQVASEKNSDFQISTTGPMIFGGCSEFCCSSTFNATDAQGANRGFVRKLRPETCCDMCKEICTDLDRFEVNFDEAKDSTPEQRVAMLTSMFLVDYMIFEHDQGWVSKNSSDGKCRINCFECYCCGCICPCQIACGGNNSGE